MAFINKTVSKTVKTTGLKVGEAITGYVTGFSRNEELDTTNILMKDENGGDFIVFPSGNLRYVIKDNKLEVGQLTRITRTEDRMVKGKKSSQFMVEQDPDSTLGDAVLNAASEPVPSVSDLKDKLASLKNKSGAASAKNG